MVEAEVWEAEALTLARWRISWESRKATFRKERMHCDTKVPEAARDH
jgi:hypothetical protein